MRWLAATALAVCAASAQGRSIRWRSVDVQALLDDRGVLRITEKQTIVFDGDWNGGERTFTVHPGQMLELHSMSRVENGTAIPMRRGSLFRVDRWDMPAPGVVRWRSRMPADPPFAERELVYVLSYSMWGALREDGHGNYTLQHEFLFADRPGPIEKASVELRLDPVWKGAESPIVVRKAGRTDNLIIERALRFTGRTAPFTPQAADGAPLSPPVRRPLVAVAVLALCCGIVLLWLHGERKTGRFDPLPAVDEAWIAEHILTMKPELAGAAYQDWAGAAAVAAVLARMAAEKKLTITPDPQDGLHLHLEVGRESLQGCERTLVEGLFFGGQSDVETSAVRAHYKYAGFDPAALIRGPLAQELDALVPGLSWSRQPRSAWSAVAFVLLAIALPLAIRSFINEQHGTTVWITLTILFGAVAMLYGALSARSVTLPRRDLITLLVLNGMSVLAVLAVSFRTMGVVRVSLEAVLTISLCAVAWLVTSLAVMKLRDLPEKIALRRRLAAARAYFKAELDADGRLRRHEEWLPWLLALELAPFVDGWRRTYAIPGPWAMASGAATLAAGVAAQAPPGISGPTYRSNRDHDRSSSSSSSSSSASSSSSSSPSRSHSGGGGGGGW
jgi:uncharacterized membrane protein YgcG